MMLCLLCGLVVCVCSFMVCWLLICCCWFVCFVWFVWFANFGLFSLLMLLVVVLGYLICLFVAMFIYVDLVVFTLLLATVGQLFC